MVLTTPSPLAPAPERQAAPSGPNLPSGNDPDNFEYQAPQPATPEKNGKGKRNAIIASIAGLSLVAGGALGFNALANASPDKDPGSTSAPVDPETTFPTVESLEISAEQDPEKIAEAVATALSNWDMVGATPGNQEAWFIAGQGNTAANYVADLSKKNAEIYGDALFVDGWKSNSELSHYAYEVAAVVNASSVENWFKSYGVDDIVYQRGFTKDSIEIIPETNGSFTVKIFVTERNNAHQNHIGELVPSELGLNGMKAVINVVVETVDGEAKISSIHTDDI